jgi:putative sensory transduction regulator
MKQYLGLLAAVGVGSVFSGAAAQSLGGGNNALVTGGMTVEEVIEVFGQEGMTAKKVDETEIAAKGWGYAFDVMGYHCNSQNRCTEFLLLVGFDLPNGFPLKKINEWNESQPAGRAYLDDENDPFLDHSISISSPRDAGAFREGLLLWLNALEDFEKFIAEQTTTS